MNPTVAMFLTCNPVSLPNGKIPTDLRTYFRPVSLIRPDFALVLKAKCSALGLKSPGILALRLKLVADLTRDQL